MSTHTGTIQDEMAPADSKLDSESLRRLCLDAGPDDVGFVDINHPEMADQKQDLFGAFARTKTLVSFVCRMNREPIRSPARYKEATVIIRDKKVQVHEGHLGNADLRLTADSRTWLGFLAKERSLVWALLSRKIRIKGSPKLLQAFGRCFPV